MFVQKTRDTFFWTQLGLQREYILQKLFIEESSAILCNCVVSALTEAVA
jgi:hypothetical protein